MILPFQNCSKKFSTDASLTETPQNTVGNPDISFTNTAVFINTASVELNFSMIIPQGDFLQSALCQVGSRVAQSCDSGRVVYNDLADGQHSLRVLVTTQNGGSVEETHVFSKDTIAPVVTVSSTPATITSSTAASFVFVTSDSLSGLQSIECSIDNGSFIPCSSPSNYNGLASGARSFRLRATDRAGNVSNIYSYSWTINTSAPTVTISSAPTAFTNSTSATFSFSGSGVVSYQCQIDGGSYVNCTSPRTYSGLTVNTSHTFRVRGTNAANVTSADAQIQWTIDTSAPSRPSLISNVGAITQLTNATVSFSSSDSLSGLSRFECSLNSAAYATCSSPVAYTALSDRQHTLNVRAVDNANNTSAVESFVWRVDTTAPVLGFTQTPQASTTDTTAAFSFSANDAGSGIATLQCSLDSAAFSNCTSPVNLSGLALGSRQFRVRATDQAGLQNTVTHNWSITSSGGGGSSNITSSITATRISGPAPLAVLFNAAGSTDSAGGNAFGDLTFSFDAGDNNSATYANTGLLKRRHSGGPLFSYVYETPSNTPYIAKVRVQNASGQWSEAQIQITVTDPNVVFSGSNTICIANTTPVAGTDGCPAGAQVRTTFLDSNSYSNKRVLLRRGHSFGELTIGNVATNVIVGSYGSNGANPVVSSLSVGAGAGGSTPSHPTQVSVSGLTINGDYGGPISGSDILLLRNQHNGSGSNAFDLGDTATGYWMSHPPSGWSSSDFPKPRRLFYFENVISASGAYGGLLDSAMVGNTIHAQAPAQHAVRAWHSIRSYIGHNVFGRVGDNIRHSFKLHSAGTTNCLGMDPNNILVDGCMTSQTVITNNRFGDVGSSNAWTVAIRPENTISSQAIEDVIVENNSFVRGGNTSVDLLMVGRRIVDRGNLTSAQQNIMTSIDGTSVNNCGSYPLAGSFCGPYFLNQPARTPNWP